MPPLFERAGDRAHRAAPAILEHRCNLIGGPLDLFDPLVEAIGESARREKYEGELGHERLRREHAPLRTYTEWNCEIRGAPEARSLDVRERHDARAARPSSLHRVEDVDGFSAL